VLWQYSKSDPLTPVRKSPKTAATENYFYSLQLADGTWDHSLEDAFGKIERTAAPIVSRLIRRGALPQGDRNWLAYFMAIQIDRSISIRRHADVQRDKAGTVDGTLRFLDKNREHLLSDRSSQEIEQYIEDVKARGYGVQLTDTFYLPYLLDGAPRLAKRIASMAWTICRPKRPHFFVTSDNPVFTRRPTWVESPGIVGIDRDDFGVELGFPLSSEQFLLARWPGRQDIAAVDCSKSRVKELNRRTVLCAHEHVFCREKSDVIQSLVYQHQGFRLLHPELDL
jgi:hypothetical protein